MRVIFIIFVIMNRLAAVRLDYEEDQFPLLIKCKRNQELSQLALCIETCIESLQYYIKKGVIMSRVEPYYRVDSYDFSTMENFDGILSLSEIQIKGLADYTISSLWISPDLSKMKFEAMFSSIKVEALYYMKATLLGRSIATSPKYNGMEAKLINNTATVIMEGEFYHKRDRNNYERQYFYVRDVQVDLNISSVNFFFHNIDNVPEISTAKNTHLNKNWPQFAPGVQRQLQHSIAIKIQSIANSIYTSQSINTLMFH